jgi:RNA polymerase sigma-70 factor (ECF subfamily)
LATRVSELRSDAAGQADVDLRDDRVLVLDFQSGRSEAYVEIYRRYRPLARSVCLRILANPDDAEEAAQETMLRVLQGLGRFNGRYAVQPWVARIATNVSLDRIRAAVRRPQGAVGLHDLGDDVRAGEDAEPGEIVERMLEGEQVRRILDALPAHHREALVLREFEGRSHREIAEALGVSPSQAKALIHRAKGGFRRAWDSNEERRLSLVPLILAPLRIPQALRRLFGSLHEAGGDVASHAVSAAASPAASGTVTAAERVTAAAVAVLTAATVSVGAIAIRRSGNDEPRARTSAAPVVALPATAPETTVVKPVVDREPQKGRVKHRAKDGTEAAEPATGPVDETPSPPPTPPPSDSPSLPPPSPPAPPEAFVGFTTSVPFVDCDCVFKAWPASTTVTGTAGDALTFRQTVQGKALEEATLDGWSVWMEYEGITDGQTGSLTMSFYVQTTDGGWYPYQATGTLDSVSGSQEEGWTYAFSGSYRLLSSPPVSVGVPRAGGLTASFDFWADGVTLIGSEIGLQEQ